MAFKLLPNTVYKTNQSHLGTIVFQAVGGDAQLVGTNVMKYNVTNGERRVVIPNFDELINISDDNIPQDTVNPMTGLTEWIGFTGDDTVVWVNTGIDEKITPAAPAEEIVNP